MELPCGHCLACKIAKSREWASRMIHEMVYYEKSVFLTCTYAEDMLPPNNSIDVCTLQLFIKRLRKAYTKNRIRYFACGEYGDGKGKREINPHYHLIVFGLGRSNGEKEIVRKCWSCPETGKSFGNIFFGTVTFHSARYVARYIEKKYNGKKEEEEYISKGLKTPFCLMSKGLGKQFAIDNSEYLEQNLGFTVQGAHCDLPRYYRNLKKKYQLSSDDFQDVEQVDIMARHGFQGFAPVLDLDKNDFIAKAIENGRELLKHYEDRGLIDRTDFDWSLSDAKRKARAQAEKTLNAKTNLRPKKL